MKPILLSCFALLLISATVHAQFAIQPQIGFEQSRTALNYGNGLSALNSNANVKAGLKLDYNVKGNTPFITLTTAAAPVLFTFDNAGTLTDRFQSGTPTLMLQAGYQYSSKAIQLGKKTAAVNASKINAGANPQGHRCGMYRSRCAAKRAAKMNDATNALNMRLQPAVALAYVPSAVNSVATTSDGITYKTAAYKTALVPSLGFEFAKGQQRLFTLNLFYTKPLTQNTETATLASGVKAIAIPLQAKTSGWGITLGIPFGFAKASQRKPAEKHQCQHNYGRCRRFQLN